MKSNGKYGQSIAAVIGGILGLMIMTTMAFARNPNPGVLPLNSHAFGMTYGEWSAAWWQWALSLPATEHPLFDTADCSEGQSGRVFFLGGKFCATNNPNCNPQSAERSCTVPAGKALFFPIVNTECSTAEGNGTTDADLRSCAQASIDLTANLSCEVDGVPIQNLQAYRVQSPLFEYTLASQDNVLVAVGEPVPDGTTSLSVSDGVYLMLAPLSVGQHTIHFHGEFPSFNFSLDITYHITVASGKP